MSDFERVKALSVWIWLRVRRFIFCQAKKSGQDLILSSDRAVSNTQLAATGDISAAIVSRS